MFEHVFTNIDQYQFDELLKRIEKFNKRAEKYQLPHLEYTVLKKEIRKDRDQLAGFYTYDVKVFTKGELKLGDWDIVGVISYELDKPYLSYVSKNFNIHDLPFDPYKVAPRCDHCKKIRRRIKTYILKNVENGEIKIVGSNCLRDFIGHNVNKILGIDKYFEELNIFDNEDFLPKGKGFGTYDAVDTLTLSAVGLFVIDKYGWISITKARNYDLTSTFDRVIAILFSLAQNDDRDEFYQHQDKYQTLAKLAIEDFDDVVNKLNDTPYKRNLSVLKNQHDIPVKGNYIATWLSYLGLWKQHVSEKDRPKNSEYIGNIGDRIRVEVVVTEKRPVKTTYDRFGNLIDLYLVQFKTDEGNIITWFTTAGEKLDKGEKYKISATIKDHKEYKGIKQTVVKNVRILEYL